MGDMSMVGRYGRYGRYEHARELSTYPAKLRHVAEHHVDAPGRRGVN